MGGEVPALPQIQIFTRFRWRWRQFDVSEGQVKDFGSSQMIGPHVNDVTLQDWSWIWSPLLCLQSARWYMQESAPMSGNETTCLPRGVAVVWLTAVLWYLSWAYGTRFLSSSGSSGSRCELPPALYPVQFSNDVPFPSKVSPFLAWQPHPEFFLSVSKTGSNLIRTCLSHVSRNC